MKRNLKDVKVTDHGTIHLEILNFITKKLPGFLWREREKKTA